MQNLHNTLFHVRVGKKGNKNMEEKALFYYNRTVYGVYGVLYLLTNVNHAHDATRDPNNSPK